MRTSFRCAINWKASIQQLYPINIIHISRTFGIYFVSSFSRHQVYTNTTSHNSHEICALAYSKRNIGEGERWGRTGCPKLIIDKMWQEIRSVTWGTSVWIMNYSIYFIFRAAIPYIGETYEIFQDSFDTNGIFMFSQ